MSRFDQYVGLTKDAENFLGWTKDNKDFFEFDHTLLNSDETLCGQCFPGKNIRVFINSNVNEYIDFVEKVQCHFWSSDPMYFTCLEGFLKKKIGQYDSIGEFFKWNNVPYGLFDNKYFRKEYNKEKGEIYL